jgi:hypothetical protein
MKDSTIFQAKSNQNIFFQAKSNQNVLFLAENGGTPKYLHVFQLCYYTYLELS